MAFELVQSSQAAHEIRAQDMHSCKSSSMNIFLSAVPYGYASPRENFQAAYNAALLIILCTIQISFLAAMS